MAIATDTARCFSTPDERDWGWSIGKLSAHHSHPGTGYANTYSHPLSLFLSPSQTNTVFLSLQHTHTHFLCVKRQGRDFIASEVMRPQLPHSLQCSNRLSPGSVSLFPNPARHPTFTLYPVYPNVTPSFLSSLHFFLIPLYFFLKDHFELCFNMKQIIGRLWGRLQPKQSVDVSLKFFTLWLFWAERKMERVRICAREGGKRRVGSRE